MANRKLFKGPSLQIGWPVQLANFIMPAANCNNKTQVYANV